jgi:hypothetical protein
MPLLEYLMERLMDRFGTRRAVLMLRAGEQREMVRWWAAECRSRNAACRRRFTALNVAAASEARRILRRYAAAWLETRGLIRALDAERACQVAAITEETQADWACARRANL